MTFIFINVSVAKPWRPPILIAPFSVAATLQPPSTNEHQKITRKRKKKMKKIQRRQFIEIGKMAGSIKNDVVLLIDRGLMDGSAYVSRG